MIHHDPLGAKREAERLADRVAIIDHGRLLVCDTPEALKRSLGEGDVLEMEVGEGALSLAQAVFENVSLTNHTLTAR